MTDKQHSLTDEMCESIYDLTCEADAMMRFAYDMGESKGRAEMLEQVIRYLENDLEFVLWSDNFMDKFKKAMRPQENI